MTGIIFLAWRNVWRNTRRSLLTVASVAMGLAAVMFGQSLLRSFQRQMIEKSTGIMLGHVQIQAAEVRDRKIPDRLLDDPQALKDFLRGDPSVEAVGARLQYTGLIYSAAASRGILVAGVEPSAEPGISILPGYMTQGRYLGRSPRDIVLGAKLARELDVRLGERLVLMAQSSGGEMGSELFRAAGFFETGSLTYDGQIVYVPLAAAQRLRGQPGKVSQVVARIKDVRQAEAFAASHRASLARPGAVLLSYRDVGSEVVGIKKFQDAILVVLLAVIFSIVGLGILNTISMSFYERIREFGVLRALGARRAIVLRVLLAEASWMGLMGALLGFGLGIGLISFFGHYGLELPLGKAMAYFMPFDDVIRMRPEWRMHIWSAAGLFGVCVASALGPALRASRLIVADALRHI